VTRVHGGGFCKTNQGPGAGEKDMAIRIALAGAGGRMGQAILRLAAASEDIEIVGALVRGDSDTVGEAVTAWPALAYTGDPDQALGSAEVMLDFSTPHSAAAVAAACADRGAALLIGTTGLDAATIDALRRRAETIPVLLAPNTSFGVNLLFQLAARAARALDVDYDVEIHEAHHAGKTDAPSGTALRLGECVAEARGLSLEDSAIHERRGQTGPRPKGAIGFSVTRAGDIPGEHTVLFAGPGERLEMTHRAGSRDTFAAGALRAARWLRGRDPGWYGMEHVLGLD
jgi:4-hydroxy-tetrahydrodipicolinate reductase